MKAILEELEALVEIYSNLSYKLVEFEESLTVYFNADIKFYEFNELQIHFENQKSFKINHFPPISTNLSFDKSSKLVDLSLVCIWLSDELLETVHRQLLKLVQTSTEGSVLWNCFQFLECDILTFLFGTQSDGFVLNIHQLIGETNEKLLYETLKDYNNRMNERNFNNSIFDCSVCTIAKRGINCIEFTKCKHVFCLTCAHDYYDIQIKTGNLDFQCMLCGENLENSEIRKFMTNDEFERWDKLILNQCLKEGKSFYNCPRCETIVLTEGDEFGICSQCFYVFCVRCKMMYHGSCCCTVIGIIIKEKERKEAIKAEEEWKNHKSCPGCKQAIVKIDGCNKMTCSYCRIYFCYLCSKILDKNQPYRHFGLAPKCYL